MNKIKIYVSMFIGILVFSQSLSCGRRNSESASNLTAEDKAFLAWAERTCVAWAESFNKQLDNGEKYRLLPDECTKFYQMYGAHLPVVVNSLHRYKKEVVNGNRRVLVHQNLFDAEMALRWQNKMINSIRYPNPVRDAILQAVIADTYRKMNQNLHNTNTEAYKVRTLDQNYFPTSPPQVSQPNHQVDTPSRSCYSCNGTGSRNFACFSCKGTGISMVGQMRQKCSLCSGKGFEKCASCIGSGKSRY
jgi:hypothetical protein